LEDKEILDNYKRNEKLIDLTQVPLTIKKEIINRYENYFLNVELEQFSYLEILPFFIKYNLKKINSDSNMLHILTPLIKNLQQLKNKQDNKEDEDLF